MVPACWAQATTTIIDDGTLVRAYRSNSPYNTAPYDNWIDVIGDNIFNTSRLVIVHSDSDVTIKAYTNYQHPNPSGYAAYPTADFAFDLDVDGVFETGFATTTHGGIQAGHLYTVSTNGWYTSLDLFGSNGGVAVAGRHDDCAANPGSCASDDVPVVKIKDGAADRGTFQFAQSMSDDPSAGTTYVNTLMLLNVNGNGEWDEFGILSGTAWCANDTIYGVVKGGPGGDIVLAAPFSLGLTGGGFAMLAAFRRRRRT
jgi:hypothetical protein